MVDKGVPQQSRDTRISRIAAQQQGVITHQQLLGCGLSRAAISKRVRTGRLHRVHQGVYALGSEAIGDRGRWMAAVRACGQDAVLSHGSAAALWELLDSTDGPIDVAVPSHSGRKRRRGIRIHRCASLAGAVLPCSEDDEPVPATTVRDDIPVTAPWRTIDDLRGHVEAKHYRRAVREAELRRYVLSPRTPRDRTRSDVERDFLRLCRRFRISEPEVNVRIGRWTVDFLWPAERLVVEVDTWGTHGGSIAFEDDHARDLDLRRRGFSICRYTDLQIRNEPDLVAADLRERLSAVPASR